MKHQHCHCLYTILLLLATMTIGSCIDEEIEPLRKELPNSEIQLLELLGEAENDRDKLNIYWKLYKTVKGEDTGRAIRYLDQQIDLAIKTDNHEALGKAYHSLGFIYDKAEKQVKAIEYYLKSYDHFGLSGHSGLQALELNNISAVLMDIGDYDYPISLLKEVENTYHKLNDTTNLVMTKMNLGICHMKKSNPSYWTAERYFDDAILLNGTVHRRQAYFFNRLYNLKGMLGYRQGKYNEAISYYQQSSKFIYDLDNKYEKQTIALYNIGESYAAAKDFDSAIKWLNRAKEVEEKYDINEKIVLEWYAIKGKLYQELGLHEELGNLLEEGINRATRDTYNIKLLSLIDMLSATYILLEEKTGNVPKAKMMELLRFKVSQEELQKTMKTNIQSETLRIAARKEIEVNGLNKKLAESRAVEGINIFYVLIFGLLIGMIMTVFLLKHIPKRNNLYL